MNKETPYILYVQMNSFTTDERRRNNPKPRTKHRFDKQLIVVAQTTNNTTVTTTVYPAAVFPSVCMGVIINGTSSGTAAAVVTWALVVVPQGTTISGISATNAATLYSPENMVLAFGACTTHSGSPVTFFVKTKTGRKINTGDTIALTITSPTATATVHTFVVQFFLKT